MNSVKKKKVKAREFLIGLACIVIALLTYFALILTNVPVGDRVAKLREEASVFQARYDSVMGPIRRQGGYTKEEEKAQMIAANKLNWVISDFDRKIDVEKNKKLYHKERLEISLWVLLGLVILMFPLRMVYYMTVWSIKTVRSEDLKS